MFTFVFLGVLVFGCPIVTLELECMAPFIPYINFFNLQVIVHNLDVPTEILN